MDSRFTWDPAKAQKNLRVHGISFETAQEVFSDPNHVVNENYFIEDQGEQRYGIIGLTRNVVLLLVVFVDRSEAEADVGAIHIISARKADDYERRAYEDQFR
jgi:uncharacterized DUF497 family protein